MKFKVGDKVICLHSFGISNRLKKGMEYTITKVDDIDFMITVDDITIWVVPDRFMLATDISRLLYKT